MKRKALALTLVMALLTSAITGTKLVNWAEANPFVDVIEKVVPAPAGAEPPSIVISFPENNTSYATNCISFTFNRTGLKSVDQKYSLLYTTLAYKASWEKDEKAFSWNYTHEHFIDMIPEGSHNVTVRVDCVYIVETRIGGNPANVRYHTTYRMSGFSTVYFTVDLPPKISITSIENKTYTTSKIALTYTINEPISKATFSLDGKNNETVNGDIVLPELSNGLHNVTVYAWDKVGNVGASETVYFNVEVPFPTALVIAASVASIAIIGAGLLVYFRKRKR
jgi:hypothetical protein